MPCFGLNEGEDAKVGEGGADAGVLSSSPREAWADAITTVPIGGTCVEMGEDGFGALGVGGVHASGEAVGGIVHFGDGFLVIVDFLDADDWAKAFFAHDIHAVIDVDKDGGSVVIARSLEAMPTK